MRILTVSAFFEGHGGGIEVVAGATARALGRCGHECRWAAAAFDAPPDDSLIIPVPLIAADPLERWTGLPMPLPSRAARRLLEREVAAADAVIIHDALYVSSLLAAKYARHYQKPWVLLQHIGPIAYQSRALRMAMNAANYLVTRRLLASTPQAVFISDAVRSFFIDTPWASEPALLLNGVDRELFRPAASRERAALRERLGISSRHQHLLFVGRFVEKKGLSVLRDLALMHPEWDLLLVGSGPIDPSTWRLPNVRILGRKQRTELAELYRAADALVLPSVGEGFPLVVQEAMASGLPVFCGLDSAAADPGAVDLLHGILVDPDDAKLTASRFGAAIGCAAPGPDRRLARYARSTYDWEGNALWLERRLRDLLLSNAARTR
ncbi:MAG TPA: glycosyltransferase family 4 protein [Sphingomicrobium sp.]|nr:glycosyltransferase family 4 protein [Sphingomicrobium sp.]